MSLHLIIGPMKSGKSFELIAQVAPYKFSDISVGLYQPLKNVRDTNITSRNGVTVNAKKVKNLSEIVNPEQVIGIDEIHMFSAKDAACIKQWLKVDIKVYVSGLDLDYSGAMTPIMKFLHELKPDTITIKQAVCDVCRRYNATYTQILKTNKPVTSGLPAIVPDDGTYEYQARCRKCFVTSANE